MTRFAHITVWHERLFARWDGSAWRAPSSRSEHATAADALAVELHRWLCDSGERVALHCADSDDPDATVIDADYVVDNFAIIHEEPVHAARPDIRARQND